MQNVLRDHKICLSSASLAVLAVVIFLMAQSFGFGPMLLWSKSGYVVVLKNEGMLSVSNVDVSFEGGEYKLSKMTGASQRVIIVNPVGESGLSLTFVSADGRPCGQHLDIYLDPSSHGVIKLSMNQDGSLTWKDVSGPFPTF